MSLAPRHGWVYSLEKPGRYRENLLQDVVEAGPSLGEREAGTTVSPAGDRPLRRSGIEERSAARELVLYDPRRGKLHVLNQTAATVWRLCDGKTQASVMVARLEAGFRDLELFDVDRDVASVLGALSQEQLLTCEDQVEPVSSRETEGGAE
jgi:hypothetical protein